MDVERNKAKGLSTSQKQELSEFTNGSLIDDGLIKHLIVDIHNYPEREFEQIKSSVNRDNILIPLILFCSLISEAKLNGLDEKLKGGI
jgi:hypothetical protein